MKSKGDITTTSTPAMLRAIVNAGLNDGWTASGAASFEAHVAQLASREAALFNVSSIMSNQVALRTYAQRPPTGVICDTRSHVIHMEAGGMASFAGALPQAVMPSNGLYLTVEDIKRKIVLSDGSDCCTCATKIIHLENPLGGLIMPLTELRRIKLFAEENNLKVHIDGARLWEAVAAGAGSLVDFCAAADSVNLCLTKGIGAPVGSILLGDYQFIRAAKWVRKTVGGSMRQPGLMATLAWAAMDDTFGRDPTGRASLLGVTHVRASRVAKFWQQLGGKLAVPQQTNIVWLDLKASGIDEVEWERIGEKHGLRLHSSRLVMHYRKPPRQPLNIFPILIHSTEISNQAVETLFNMMREVMKDYVGRTPLLDPNPRNEAVSRVGADMEEALKLAERRT